MESSHLLVLLSARHQPTESVCVSVALWMHSAVQSQSGAEALLGRSIPVSADVASSEEANSGASAAANQKKEADTQARPTSQHRNVIREVARWLGGSVAKNEAICDLPRV